jgi:hypothetical protein
MSPTLSSTAVATDSHVISVQKWQAGRLGMCVQEDQVGRSVTIFVPHHSCWQPWHTWSTIGHWQTLETLSTIVIYGTYVEGYQTGGNDNFCISLQLLAAMVCMYNSIRQTELMIFCILLYLVMYLFRNSMQTDIINTPYYHNLWYLCTKVSGRQNLKFPSPVVPSGGHDMFVQKVACRQITTLSIIITYVVYM